MGLFCDSCKTRWKAGTGVPGSKVKCPKCGSLMTVPTAAAPMAAIVLPPKPAALPMNAMSMAVPANPGITARPLPGRPVGGMAPVHGAFTPASRSGPALGLLIGAGVAVLLLAVTAVVVVAMNSGGNNQTASTADPPAPPPETPLPPDDSGKKPTTKDDSRRPDDPGDKIPNTPAKDDGKNPAVPPDSKDPKDPKGKNDGRLGDLFDIEFMGSKAKGKRICIIADVSGSMNAQMATYNVQTKQVTKGRKLIDFLKAELDKTLKSLKPEAEFFVILFDSKTEQMPGKRWLTGKEIDKVLPWVHSIYPRGGTVPLPAFQQAFALQPRPDLIFFMTDGAFPNCSRAIADLNRAEPRVIINTIQLSPNYNPNPAAPKKLSIQEQQMHDIASQNGGVFSKIDGAAVDR